MVFSPCRFLASQQAPLDGIGSIVMEHAMGALHNVMLTGVWGLSVFLETNTTQREQPVLPLEDVKAKARAVEGGVAYGLARALSAKLPENHTIPVRARMLISDLLQVPHMQVQRFSIT